MLLAFCSVLVMMRRRLELLPHGNLGFSRSSERTTSDAIRAEGERDANSFAIIYAAKLSPRWIKVSRNSKIAAKCFGGLPLGNPKIQNSYIDTNMSMCYN